MKIGFDVKDVTDKIQSKLDVRAESEKYYKDLITDEKPIKVKGNIQNIYSYTSYKLVKGQYYFSSFEQIEIGDSVALREEYYLVIERKRINFCSFEKCIFENIRFIRCDFTGCKFNDVKFNNVVFESCFFSRPYINDEKISPNNPYTPTIFIKCIFVARFVDCKLKNDYFESCLFTLSKFQNCDMNTVYMKTCVFCDVEIKDTELMDFKLLKSDILDIYVTDDKCSKVNEETTFDCKIYAKRPREGTQVQTESGWKTDNYDDMMLEKAKTLRRISSLFEKNGYSSIAGEYFYQSKRIERKSLHGAKKMISTGSLILCGYGERPLFTMVSMIVSILVFALIYMFTGFSTGNQQIFLNTVIEAWPHLTQILKYYGHSVFFSVTTFSTVGYGNYVPVGEISSCLAAVQMIIGISLSALWTGCVFRKIAR